MQNTNILITLKWKYYTKKYYKTYLIQIIKIKLYKNKIIISANESMRF